MLLTGARNPNIKEILIQRQLFHLKYVNIIAVLQQNCIKYRLNFHNCREVCSTLNFYLISMNTEVVLLDCYRLILEILTSRKHCVNISFLLQICQYHGYFVTILKKIYVEYSKLQWSSLNIEFSPYIDECWGSIVVMLLTGDRNHNIKETLP